MDISLLRRNRSIMFFKMFICMILITYVIPFYHSSAFAQSTTTRLDSKSQQFMESIAKKYDIPWTQLAAVAQYEFTRTKKNQPFQAHATELWNGMLAPLEHTSSIIAHAFFGRAMDGDRDGIAHFENQADQLAALATELRAFGSREEDFWIAIWEKYQSARSVERIIQFERLLREIPIDQLSKKHFPIPVNSDLVYKDTWGNARGWGGRRSHEGTDLFAHHGVPVYSTCYGVVEMVGWNIYGGWRVGIRDIHNVYHYFAHLSGFAKDLRPHQIVKPGQVIAWVGSSGYGKPGTSGKFPPHLHFGMYRDNGEQDWAFNPYPSLRRWEAEVRAARALRRQSLRRTMAQPFLPLDSLVPLEKAQ